MPLLALSAGLAGLLVLAWSAPVSDAIGRLRGRLAVATLLFGAAIVLARASGAPSADTVLAAVGGGLLLIAAAALLVAPEPDERTPTRVFWTALVVYLSLVPWSTEARPPNGDEPWYLLMTHSLAYDADLDLADNYERGDSLAFMARRIEPQLNDPRGAEGQIYSRHSPALPLLLAVPYRVGGLAGAQITLALLTAWLAGAFTGLARRRFPARGREVAWTATLFALAPPLLLYSHQIWAEVPAALLVTLALSAVIELRSRTEDPTSRALWARLAIALLLLPLLKLRFLPIAVGVLGVAAFELPRHRRALGGLAASVLGGALILALFNRALVGQALGIHQADELLVFKRGALAFVQGALGPFLDVGFGLFFAAPLWLLLLPALARLRGRALVWLALICGPYLVLLASRQEWYGGFSPPFRYGVVLLPLLALALVPLLQQRDRATSRVLIAALASASFGVAILQIAVPGWAYNLADGRTLLLDHASQVLQQDVSRLFPSYTRLRLASWIWPAAALLLILLWGRGPRRPAGFGASWGVALLLVVAACSPALLGTLPTTRLEAESPHVSKTGGHSEPARWTENRTRFPESWVLREFEILQAPIVPGGDTLTLTARLRFIANRDGALQLRVLDRESGDTLGRSVISEHDVWSDHVIGPMPWSGSRTLRVEVTPEGAPGPPGVSNGLVLDRLDLAWE